MKCTGMREAWKMVTLARALGMKVMVGCMTETSCAVSAAWTILSGRRLCRSGRKPADSERPLQRDGSCKGKITLNDLPGIGVVKI